MSRNFGLPHRERPSVCGELARLAAFVVIMFGCAFLLITGVLYIQHTLRGWGFHV